MESIKQRLADGKLTRVMFLGALASPKLVQIVGSGNVGSGGGLHGIFFDQEHAAIPPRNLELMLLACRSVGLDAFSRVAPTDYTAIMRPMEAGACGVMVAQIRSVEQVREVVRWAKFPPVGTRGIFLGCHEAGYGTRTPAAHVETSNRDRWLAIQIETREAVECVDEIAAVDGVDHLFVGPGDLACTLGVPGQPLHPTCIDALERVAAAVKAQGKSWGVLPLSPEHATKCRELGCTLFSIVGDLDLVHRGMKATRELYSEFF